MQDPRGEPRLPIDAVREAVLRAVEQGPLVLEAATGSGKSTMLPQWFAERGRVLVIEPRRVACRGLAARVAALRGGEPGGEVGYVVRGERRADARSQIVFVTPGVAIRWLVEGKLAGFPRIMLDEFHERGLETDLLAAVLAERCPERLVVTSATLEGERLAAWLQAEHIVAEGRTFPVVMEYAAARGEELPSERDLSARVARVVIGEGSAGPDTLVFLPGKREIREAAEALEGQAGLRVFQLHGGLALGEQAEVFRSTRERKVVLATNVAESSITIPGIRLVIDSGLERRDVLHRGRTHLTLGPIARDAADQRAGRAGRESPGRALRLWASSGRLEARTTPAIRRSALASLWLDAVAVGVDPEVVDWFDPPPSDALSEAREELQALGALEDQGGLTERGRRLHGLPLDPALGAWLVAALATGHADRLDATLDLVATLAVDRPLFRGPAPEQRDAPREDLSDPELDPRVCGCDATARIHALHARSPRAPWLDPAAWALAREVREELREAFGCRGRGAPPAAVKARDLARVLLQADPRAVHAVRRRKRAVAWSNGGTEVTLARESAVDEERIDLIAVLDQRGIGSGRDAKRLVTAAMPVPRELARELGLGRERIVKILARDGTLQVEVERAMGSEVFGSRMELPVGDAAREALHEWLLGGGMKRRPAEEGAERFEAWRLLARLEEAGRLPGPEAMLWATLPEDAARAGVLEAEDHAAWLRERIAALGFESGEDLALLGPEDLMPPALSSGLADYQRRRWPLRLERPGGRWSLSYRMGAREVLARPLGTTKKAPDAKQLPQCEGFRFVFEGAGGRRSTLR